MKKKKRKNKNKWTTTKALSDYYGSSANLYSSLMLFGRHRGRWTWLPFWGNSPVLSVLNPVLVMLEISQFLCAMEPERRIYLSRLFSWFPSSIIGVFKHVLMLCICALKPWASACLLWPTLSTLHLNFEFCGTELWVSGGKMCGSGASCSPLFAKTGSKKIKEILASRNEIRILHQFAECWSFWG